MSDNSPRRPIARLTTELRVTGLGQFALGLACLVVALTSSDLRPVRAIVPFAIAFVAVGAVSAYGSRWMRTAATPPAPDDAVVEPHALTVRRGVMKAAVALLVVALAVASGPVLGVVFGGIVAAAGAAEIRDYTWLSAREKSLRREIHAERGRFPLVGGTRALYTRPISAVTLRT